MNIETFRGHWALVTGASSGIGLAYAEALAERGMSLYLVALEPALLEEVAQGIRLRFGSRVETCVVDLSTPGSAERIVAAAEVHGIRVRLLCHAAGFGRWGNFLEGTTDEYERMVGVHALALVGLSRAFFPHLASYEQSALVCVSSVAAFFPLPHMSVYAASKSFVTSFGLALSEEWRSQGVYVQVLHPGPTDTRFDERAHAYPIRRQVKRMQPSDVVRSSLAHFQQEAPLVILQKGVCATRLFVVLAPVRFMLRKMAKLFQPKPERA